MRDGPLQAVERLVDLGRKGIDAPQVIEKHRFLGFDSPRAASPASARAYPGSSSVAREKR
jgi:hypothetical protein